MICIGISLTKQKQTHRSKVDGRKLIYRYKVHKAYCYDDYGHFFTKYLKGIDLLIWGPRITKLHSYECEICDLKYRSNIKRCPRCEL